MHLLQCQQAIKPTSGSRFEWLLVSFCFCFWTEIFVHLKYVFLFFNALHNWIGEYCISSAGKNIQERIRNLLSDIGWQTLFRRRTFEYSFRVNEFIRDFHAGVMICFIATWMASDHSISVRENSESECLRSTLFPVGSAQSVDTHSIRFVYIHRVYMSQTNREHKLNQTNMLFLYRVKAKDRERDIECALKKSRPSSMRRVRQTRTHSSANLASIHIREYPPFDHP